MLRKSCLTPLPSIRCCCCGRKLCCCSNSKTCPSSERPNHNSRKEAEEASEEPALLFLLLDLVEVSIGVDVVDWVIDHIAIAVMVLGVIELRDKRVWADESSKLWVIVSATIVVETGLWIKHVAGESPAGIANSFLSGDLPPWVILDKLDSRSEVICNDIDPT